MSNAEQTGQVFRTVDLDFPIVRGDQTIDKLQIRKPGSGEMRGLTLSDLLKVDVASLIKLLPRITSPSLTEQEVATKLDPADLATCGGEVVTFLLTRAQKAEHSLET